MGVRLRNPYPAAAFLALPASGYRLVAWLFLRLLALVYLAAFASLAVQIHALAGPEGIYPLTEQLARATELHGHWRLLSYPSLFWLSAEPWALSAVAWGGCLLSLLLLIGWRERAVLILLFVFYLSLVHAAQIFCHFQWDYLLLETGFVAILLPGGSRWTVWLFRWVLFKLRFLSGLSKLLSGDPAWRDMSALKYYFETQPLPHVGAWYAHWLPDWLLRTGTAGTLFVELIVPFFMFLPRPWRLFAAGATILWQVLILATSNHNFFNLLTIVLCLFLLDDRAVARLLPAGWVRRATQGSPLPERPRRRMAVATLAFALLAVPVSLISAVEMAKGHLGALSRAAEWIEPFRVANRYHVFPTIDTERIAVQIDASRDGTDWVPLDLRYAPDDPAEAPAFVVPHQPRIDWMLWFVPKGPVFLDWFERWLKRLAAGSPAVLATLAEPPFGDHAPRQLRVSVYRYRFASPEERAASGVWWTREFLGPFMPLPYVEARE